MIPCLTGVYLQVDVNNLLSTGRNIANLSSTNGAGGILDIFYAPWKFRLMENPKIVQIMQSLWQYTYCSNHIFFESPFGSFDYTKALMYIDRVCFRLPDNIINSFGGGKRKKLQRSLTPHLDCCPDDVCSFKTPEDVAEKMNKWRPIQCFIALTDTINPNEGGFEACPGLHARFKNWAEFRLASAKVSVESHAPPCVGSFSPIRPIEDRDIILLFEHISCRAGDMVCWDYRIPHSNSRYNNGNEAREVVYIGLLPYVSLNTRYVQKQLSDYLAGKNPSDQWVHNTNDGVEDGRNKEAISFQFSSLGEKLIGISEWD